MTRACLLPLLLPLLLPACAGIQGRDHAYIIAVVSEPKYEPKASIMAQVLAPLTDLTGVPKGILLGSAVTEAVRAAGNAKVKVTRASFPVKHGQGYLIQATDAGFSIQSLPLTELQARAGAPMLPKGDPRGP